MRRKPHKLQFLETLATRKKLNPEQQALLQKLQRGVIGEENMDLLVESILGAEVDCLDDITLEYQGSVVQIDKLLIIGSIIYLIDMKFYRGHYIFKNGEWYLGEKILANNNFEQLRRAVRIIQNVLHDHQIPLKVQGVLAFMNPESSLTVEDNLKETVLNFTDISTWLLQLKQNTTNKQLQDWKSAIRNYEIAPYRTKEIFPLEKMDTLQKGICCPNCHQFNMNENRHTVSCPCGYTEAKEIAFTRTMCECGVIFHNQNLTRPQLKAFLGKDLNPRYLDYLLEKHFEHLGRPKARLGYHNKGILFDYWFAAKKDYFEQLARRTTWKNANISM
ncbi:NERD domain-containing protein [Tetragenococcus koreensis]|uniref:NERD domain-containing protein n=1 Tax=Tetragenococcus koreensis TaxID=290335 RepID=A0AAN4RK81_9ENTE|nr:nuclease-related domain-containing protein [Tetragenococcus koreensis]MCF1585302.1 NERD domain-containing protein [Tetragenococcus koreensis]MCF1614891.1 NERD domain-containing protein [Tetragenococcus koreensis]MCF1616376.1 NERD domain-containing protein [Tetragenococcus koreensis]MCF1618898.1 NERD domain-containing protein [Tetragenococcus koreensis]MCF1621289.1 NERD domain-containing protein [Tetragenococcus koreensis]